MTWKLSLQNGACSIPRGVTLQMVIPQPFAAPNPPAGYVKVYSITTDTYNVYINVNYQACVSRLCVFRAF